MRRRIGRPRGDGQAAAARCHPGERWRRFSAARRRPAIYKNRQKEILMPALDPRQKAERIAAVFRARQPIDSLPDELIPGDLAEAYRVREAYEAIEAPRRGAVVGYKIGLTTP